MSANRLTDVESIEVELLNSPNMKVHRKEIRVQAADISKSPPDLVQSSSDARESASTDAHAITDRPSQGLQQAVTGKVLEYMENTSAHAAPNIWAAITVIGRISWIICVLVAFLLFLWQTFALVKVYLSHPVVVNRKVCIF